MSKLFALGTRAAKGLEKVSEPLVYTYKDLLTPQPKPQKNARGIPCTIVCRETPDYTRLYGPKYMHRGQPKVTAQMTIKVKDVKLEPLQREVFLTLCGPRLRRNSDTIHITVDNMPTTQASENRCHQILEKLLLESKSLAEQIRTERASGAVEKEIAELEEISPTRPLNADEWRVHVETVKSSPLNF